MQSIITFENKVALNENADIPAVNKIRDVDINEIKAIVNDSLQGTNAMGSIVVDDINCKNMFNIYTSKFGYVLGSDGGESVASGFLISDYIPVKPNTQYTISRVLNSVTGAEDNMRIGYYQQDKTFISRAYSSDNPYTITTPNNCYFVKLSYQYESQGQTSNDDVQLELGDIATTYNQFKNIIKEQNGYVKEDTTFYANDFKCRNMLNPYTFIKGNISNTGSYQANNVNYLSDYIEVEPNTQYIASANVSQPFFQISEWTSNKTFIQRTALQNTATNAITTTATTKYVRISYNKDNSTTMTQEILLGFEPQFELGTTRTSYTPYQNFDNTAYTLWINSSPTSSFAGQQITLSDDINNYSFYEIIFLYSTSSDRALNSGKIPVKNTTILNTMLGYIYLRLITAVSGNKITFGNGLFVNPYGTTTDNNDYVIPYQVIGYK